MDWFHALDLTLTVPMRVAIVYNGWSRRAEAVVWWNHQRLERFVDNAHYPGEVDSQLERKASRRSLAQRMRLQGTAGESLSMLVARQILMVNGQRSDGFIKSSAAAAVAVLFLFKL